MRFFLLVQLARSEALTSLRPPATRRLTTMNGGAEGGPRPGPAGAYDSAVALGAAKAVLPTPKLLTLSFLSGAHIALGAFLAVTVGGSVPGLKAAHPGVQRILLGAFGLPMGLLMVLVGGGELVTGNFALIGAAAAANKATASNLARNWAIVFLGNLVGSLAVAGIGTMAATGVAEGAMAAARGKVAASFSQALGRGILCNWLVCMAVWMASSTKDVAGKAAAVFFPISGFVALGLDHSVANMFLIPFGMMQGAKDIALSSFIMNIIPVTLGNIIGGALFVGLAYHNAYGK